MEKYLKFLTVIMCISLISCRSIVSNPGKPLIDKSIELGRSYEIQDFNAKIYTIKICAMDDENIYGIAKGNERVIIKRSDIRQMKKWQVLNSVIVGALAVAAVIFIPI